MPVQMSSSLLLCTLLCIGTAMAATQVEAAAATQAVEANDGAYPQLKQCAMDFGGVDYSAVTSVCKAPHYDEKACCGAFKRLACAYSSHVNDYTTFCPIQFISYLNLAGAYPNGLFVPRCTSEHRLC